MRLAYIISAYKSADLLIRVVHRLHTPTSIILIHVDKRTDRKQYRDMTEGVSHLIGVILVMSARRLKASRIYSIETPISIMFFY
jgi:hypothetical protein